MKKFFRILSIVLLFTLLLFTTACTDSQDESQNITYLFNHVGKSFAWFFGDLTPAYFHATWDVWGLLDALKNIWEIPSLIGVITGIIMSIVIFIVALLVIIILIICYIGIFVVFVAIFLILAIVAILGTIAVLILSI